MLGWGAAVQLTSGLAVLAVAAALIVLGPGRRPTRVFALVLALWGLVHVSGALALYPDDPNQGALWADLHAYVIIELPFTIAYFAGVFPREARWLPRGWRMPALFAAVALILLVLYGSNHSLFWDTAGYSSSTEPYGDPAVPKGPLVVFVRLIEILAALVAIRLTRYQAAVSDELTRRSALLVGLGFFIPAACTCALVDFLYRLQSGLLLSGSAGGGFSPAVGLAYDFLIAVQLLLIVYLVSYLLWEMMRTGNRKGRLNIFAYVTLLAATGLSAIAIMTLLRGENQLQGGYAAWGFWSFVGACLIAYGVLRRDLFGIDLKLKWTLRNGTIASSFVAVFFIASEGTKEWVSGWLGPIVGIAAAALLLFAIAPLQRLADRLANRALPNVDDTPAYRQFRAMEVYKAAVQELMRGGISSKERRALDALGSKLNLSVQDTVAIERDTVPRQARIATRSA